MVTLIQQIKHFVTNPTALPSQVAAAEEALGFVLPSFFRILYIEVGDGGFGPGSTGLYSLSHLVQTYRYYCADPEWPEDVLEICDHGCGITSNLWCGSPGVPVVRLDPNFEEYEPVAPRAYFTDNLFRLPPQSGPCWIEAASLEAWFQAWVNQMEEAQEMQRRYKEAYDKYHKSVSGEAGAV